MFQGNRNVNEDEMSGNDAVSVYFWPGDNDKKVDHVSLRTRGARGYDLKVVKSWPALPINEHLDVSERQLRLNLRARLINILVPEGAEEIHYRLYQANEEIIEGAIREADLELPAGSFASHVQRNMIGCVFRRIRTGIPVCIRTVILVLSEQVFRCIRTLLSPRADYLLSHISL